MEVKHTIVIFVCAIAFFACRSQKAIINYVCKVEHRRIQVKANSIPVFSEVVYPGYRQSYNFLADSLKLLQSDTFGFLIRPCYTHRGICVTTKNLYYFDFSGKGKKVFNIPNSCPIIETYFSFLTTCITPKETEADTVLIIPDCPVDFIFKLKTSLFYTSITGNKINIYSQYNYNLKRLLHDCDSLMNKYK